MPREMTERTEAPEDCLSWAGDDFPPLSENRMSKKQKKADEPLTTGDIPTNVKAVLDSLTGTSTRGDSGSRAPVDVTRTHSSSENKQAEDNIPLISPGILCTISKVV